jgi:hypothetical protein
VLANKFTVFAQLQGDRLGESSPKMAGGRFNSVQRTNSAPIHVFGEEPMTTFAFRRGVPDTKFKGPAQMILWDIPSVELSLSEDHLVETVEQVSGSIRMLENMNQ